MTLGLIPSIRPDANAGINPTTMTLTRSVGSPAPSIRPDANAGINLTSCSCIALGGSPLQFGPTRTPGSTRGQPCAAVRSIRVLQFGPTRTPGSTLTEMSGPIRRIPPLQFGPTRTPGSTHALRNAHTARIYAPFCERSLFRVRRTPSRLAEPACLQYRRPRARRTGAECRSSNR